MKVYTGSEKSVVNVMVGETNLETQKSLQPIYLYYLIVLIHKISSEP